jgi:uncharacterized membrane protein YccC
VLELFGSGPFTILGTLCGLLLAFLVHKFGPALADAAYLWAALVGAGFVIGLAIDFRSKRTDR